MLGRNTGFSFIHVPYKGSAPLLPDLFSGQIDATFVAATLAKPYIQDRKIRALAISAPGRAKSLPEVPTFEEAGIVDVQASFIIAFSAPAGTPADIVDKLAASVRAIVTDPQFQAQYMDPFAYVPVGSSPASFGAYVAQDRKRQRERIEASGVSGLD